MWETTAADLRTLESNTYLSWKFVIPTFKDLLNFTIYYCN
jgi:hypothetical protein